MKKTNQGEANGQDKGKKSDLPEMDYRPIFVQFIGVRKCRFNPSFEGFHRLPAFLKNDVIAKREAKHGEGTLPPLEISRKKVRK
jgi:hypothetical protein